MTPTLVGGLPFDPVTGFAGESVVDRNAEPTPAPGRGIAARQARMRQGKDQTEYALGYERQPVSRMSQTVI